MSLNKFSLVLSICFFSSSYLFAQKQYEEGLKAFDAKDYQKALIILRPYAEKGNCLAQYVVGFSYQYGLSVIASDTTARRWLTLAAEQKQTNAMGPLAANLMMSDTPGDIVRAYMWAVLAAEYVPVQRATTTRYLRKEYLKPEELEKANQLIEAYKNKWKDTKECL